MFGFTSLIFLRISSNTHHPRCRRGPGPCGNSPDGPGENKCTRNSICTIDIVRVMADLQNNIFIIYLYIIFYVIYGPTVKCLCHKALGNNNRKSIGNKLTFPVMFEFCGNQQWHDQSNFWAGERAK